MTATGTNQILLLSHAHEEDIPGTVNLKALGKKIVVEQVVEHDL